MDLFFGNAAFHRRQDKYINFILYCFKGISLAFFAWILGYFHVGYSIVCIFVSIYVVHLYYQKKQAQKRLAGKLLSADERNTIITTMKDLPSWVFFPDIEKAEWLNKVIAQIWPFLTKYVQGFLTNEMQPIIEAKLPAIVRPFRFSKIDLGDISPRIGGIKTYCGEDTPRDEVSMDVEFYLYSDAGVKVELKGITSGIKDLEIRGTLRILLRPLISKLPLVGAVTVCFINNPYINFELTNLGNMLEFPGVGEIFRAIVEDVLAAVMVLPNRFSLRLVKEVELSQLRHPIPQGLIRIHVESASNLIAMDIRPFAKNTSDPYCILKVGAQQFKTAVIKNDLNPTWDEYFEAIIDQRVGQVLELLVYDKDTALNKGDFLGRASIAIEDVYNNGMVDTWVQLEGVKSGSVHLIITWLDLCTSSIEFQNMMEFNKTLCRKKQFILSSGFLYVVVDSAKGLKAKSAAEPSPCGRISLGSTTKTLKVVHDTPNPVWEKAMHFGVVDPELDTLKIELYHHNVGEKASLIGDYSVPTKILLDEPDMKLERPFHLNHTIGGQGGSVYLRLALRALVVGKKQRRATNSLQHCHSVEDVRGSTVCKQMPFQPRTPSERDEDFQDMNGNEHTKSDSIKSINISVSTLPSVSSKADLPRGPSSVFEVVDDSQSVVRQLDLEENSLFATKVRRPDYGKLEIALSYSIHQQILSVTIGRARSLIALDADGVSDPYVKVGIEPKRLIRNQVQSLKTEIKHNTLNPEFKETFEIPIEQRYLPQATLVILVCNHVGLFQRGKKSMGNVRLKLSSALTKQNYNNWFPIVPPFCSTTSLSANSLGSSGHSMSIRNAARSSMMRLRNIGKHKKRFDEAEENGSEASKVSDL